MRILTFVLLALAIISCDYLCAGSEVSKSLGGVSVTVAHAGITSTSFKLGGRVNTTLEGAYALVPDDIVGDTIVTGNTWETLFDVNEIQRMTKGGPTFIQINTRQVNLNAKVDIRVGAPTSATNATNLVIFDSIFQSYIVNGQAVLRVTGRYTGSGNLITTSSTPSGAIVGDDPKPRYMGTHPTSRTFAIDYPLLVVAQAILDGREMGLLLHVDRDDFSPSFYPQLKIINFELTTEGAYETWPAAECTNEIIQCINNNQNDTSICGDAYHVSRCPLKCRLNDGKSFVSVGSVYFNKCNSCQCSANGLPGICDRKGCGNSICYDNQGKGYAKGATRKQDSCNTCTCQQDGTWTCENTCPTTTPPRVCIQGGQPPAACPGEGESVWDNKICAFVCKTCGERGVGCSVMDCRIGYKCVEDPSTCDATCQVSDPVMCIAMCKQVTCPGYKEQQTVCNKVINNVCTWECPAPPQVGTVVLTVSFTLRWKGAQKKNDINAEMWSIAKKAGVEYSFAIDKQDIKQLPGGNQKWSIKVGFKGDTKDARKSASDKFIAILRQYSISDVIVKAATTTWELDNEETITTETATMTTQTCPDGNEMSVDQQCPMVNDLIVPASTSSSSSPIAVIIAPIVAGIVLVTAIATAIIIIRRRRINTIKTMDRIETQMTNNPAITSQV